MLRPNAGERDKGGHVPTTGSMGGAKAGKTPDKKVLDAAGQVVTVWLDSRVMTGQKKLDQALDRLTKAYREWEGSS